LVKKSCTYHESELLKTPYRAGTLIFQHFALSWLLSNFLDLQNYNKNLLLFTKFGHCPTSQKVFTKLELSNFSNIYKRKSVKVNTSLIVLRIFKCNFSTKRFQFAFQNGENLRQQTYSQFSQSEAFLCLDIFDKTNLQIVPKNGLLICASSYKCIVI
jgi:hypothetical protein